MLLNNSIVSSSFSHNRAGPKARPGKIMVYFSANQNFSHRFTMSENMNNVLRQNADDEASKETIFHKRALSVDRDENLTSRSTSVSGYGVDSSTKMAKLEMTKNQTEERFNGSFNSSPTGREVSLLKKRKKS